MLKLSQFQDVLECYHENIYAEQDVYYFFDEVQYAQDWDRWLKIIYDTQPNTRVVATGSASPALMEVVPAVGLLYKSQRCLFMSTVNC